MSSGEGAPKEHSTEEQCSTQYKGPKVFGKYQRLTQKYDQTVIIYYGLSGHGKCLVDATSAFGVKTPIRHAVLPKILNTHHPETFV